MSKSTNPGTSIAEKDPIRVITGRLGALATHSRGHTSTDAARAAFEDRFRREVDPENVLPLDERERRATFARRSYFTRLALHRHRGTALRVIEKAVPTGENVGTANEEVRRASDADSTSD